MKQGKKWAASRKTLGHSQPLNPEMPFGRAHHGQENEISCFRRGELANFVSSKSKGKKVQGSWTPLVKPLSDFDNPQKPVKRTSPETGIRMHEKRRSNIATCTWWCPFVLVLKQPCFKSGIFQGALRNRSLIVQRTLPACRGGAPGPKGPEPRGFAPVKQLMGPGGREGGGGGRGSPRPFQALKALLGLIWAPSHPLAGAMDGT